MEVDSSAIKECGVCLTVMVEPVKISCGHSFCLTCLEQIISNNADNNIKCPMDRKQFNFKTDLKCDKTAQNVNFELEPKVCFERAQQIVDYRKQNSSLTELSLVYGNFHTLLNSGKENKHEWTAFVSISEAQSEKKKIFENLKKIANLEEVVGNNCFYDCNNEFNAKKEFEQKIANSDLFDNQDQISDDRIIKRVVFKLHPTFTPSAVFVSEAPFKISRIGWGMFNISMIVEFQDHLEMESIELEHFLDFNKNVCESRKSFFVDLKKVNGDF